jgi:hypothetical protein
MEYMLIPLFPLTVGPDSLRESRALAGTCTRDLSRRSIIAKADVSRRSPRLREARYGGRRKVGEGGWFLSRHSFNGGGWEGGVRNSPLPDCLTHSFKQSELVMSQYHLTIGGAPLRYVLRPQCYQSVSLSRSEINTLY